MEQLEARFASVRPNTKISIDFVRYLDAADRDHFQVRPILLVLFSAKKY